MFPAANVTEHPVVGLCRAFYAVSSVWMLEEDGHVTPDQYEVACLFDGLFCAGVVVRSQAAHVVQLSRRGRTSSCVHALSALHHHCFRCDILIRCAWCVTETSRYIGLRDFAASATPSGLHYKRTGTHRTKLFNCIPCEAHGQVVKKNWYRSRQRSTWLNHRHVLRRGYSQILELDNIYINSVVRKLQ